MLMKFIARGHIRTRILKALLVVSCLALICFAVISLNGMRRLGAFAEKSSTGLGEEALKISKTALEDLTKDSLLRITIDRANLCNAEFREIEATVNTLAEIAEKVWNNQGIFPRNRSYGEKEEPKDKGLYSIYQYPAGVDFSRIKADLEISSAMDSFFRPFLANNPTIGDFNIGTPGGLFRRFPWAPVAPGYDVRKRDWFNRAVDTGRAGWSDPYVGAIAKNLRINFSKPVFRNNRLAAVVAINVPLHTINERIISTRLNNRGSAVLVDRYRKIIAREGMSTDSENWADPQKAEYFNLDPGTGDQKKFEDDLLAARSGIHRGSYKGKDCFIAHAPVESTRWSFLFIMPVEAINEPIIPTERAILYQAKTFTSQVASKIRWSLFTLTIIFFAAVVGIYLIAKRVANLITEPILVLDAGAKVIGSGDLGHRIEIHSGDEIEALANTFNTMTESLQEYIRNLTETTAAKERIQSELKVATDIQASLLPRLFPAFPDRREFDIYAHMDPAKEVGGDFYDLFLVDDKTLCFLIADVSDKGVPAALYMMVSKTLLKTEALRGLQPDEILSRVNNILAQDNDSCMFVTVFCALLDTESGELRFANAGHNPPLICCGEHGFDYLKIESGFVLGPMSDSRYTVETLTMKENDILFLYTDGVTEAKNPKDELYGEKQLRDALNRGDTGDLSGLVRFIRDEVENHASGAPQSDDVTMLAVKFKGNHGNE